MAFSTSTRSSLEQDYQSFLAIKDTADALDFVKAHYPTPIENDYFTPADYHAEIMLLRRRLREKYDHKWNSLWGWSHRKDKNKGEDQFYSLLSLVIQVSIQDTHYVDDWVSSRYDVPIGSYLIPREFTSYEVCGKDEAAKEDWELEDNLAASKRRKKEGDYQGVQYYWKKVNPSRENLNDGRRHYVLIDIDTSQEAPLLPGINPY